MASPGGTQQARCISQSRWGKCVVVVLARIAQDKHSQIVSNCERKILYKHQAYWWIICFKLAVLCILANIHKARSLVKFRKIANIHICLINLDSSRNPTTSNILIVCVDGYVKSVLRLFNWSNKVLILLNPSSVRYNLSLFI